MPIVIKRSDGGVSILSMIDAEDAETEVGKWKDSSPGEYVSHREMPDEAVPLDRTFRDAWADLTRAPTIDYDMPKCREIWRNKMRAARAPKLQALDVEFQRALESGLATKSISAAKQTLRDVTSLPEINGAKTPDELKAIWPAVLA